MNHLETCWVPQASLFRWKCSPVRSPNWIIRDNLKKLGIHIYMPAISYRFKDIGGKHAIFFLFPWRLPVTCMVRWTWFLRIVWIFCETSNMAFFDDFQADARNSQTRTVIEKAAFLLLYGRNRFLRARSGLQARHDIKKRRRPKFGIFSEFHANDRTLKPAKWHWKSKIW